MNFKGIWILFQIFYEYVYSEKTAFLIPLLADKFLVETKLIMSVSLYWAKIKYKIISNTNNFFKKLLNWVKII